MAWCRAANEDQDVAAALDAVVLPDEAGRAGAALLAAGEVYARTGVVQPNGSALHDALAGGGMGGVRRALRRGDLAGVVATLAQADDDLAAARFTDADGAITQRELRQAVALARHGALAPGPSPRPALPPTTSPSTPSSIASGTSRPPAGTPAAGQGAWPTAWPGSRALRGRRRDPDGCSSGAVDPSVGAGRSLRLIYLLGRD